MTLEMSLRDFYALLPLLILFLGSMIVLLVESFASHFAKKYGRLLTLLILLVSGVTSLMAPASQNPLITSWIRFDPLAQFFSLFFIFIGISVVALSPRSSGEYFFLLLSSLMGLLLISSSADFLTLFLGIETLSIPLYILCGFIKKREISHESAAKYFLTGALATAFLVYGIALVYGAVGVTKFETLLPQFHSIVSSQDQALFFGGIAFISLALLFKATIVPFHQWAPDVYAGAPTAVTAFMAVATKAGAFAALILLFFIALPNFNQYWNEIISWFTLLTLLYANFVALKQTQMRRFFAYSGIAQAGFMLIPFAVSHEGGKEAVLFYLVIYCLATLGCFGVLSALDERQEGVRLQDLRGLFKRAPIYCLLFSFCLLTLAGLPPTAGFLGKFLILKEAFQEGYFALVAVALATSILSIFYYLRPIALMLSEPSKETVTFKEQALVTCSLLAGFLFFISLFPLPLWNYLKELK